MNDIIQERANEYAHALEKLGFTFKNGICSECALYRNNRYRCLAGIKGCSVLLLERRVVNSEPIYDASVEEQYEKITELAYKDMSTIISIAGVHE